MPNLPDPHSAFSRAWADARAGLKGVVLISCVINVLMLAGPLYMLQVYDRVLASRSLETLAVLTLALLIVFAMQAWFDAQRTRIVTRIGGVIDSHLRGPVLSTLIRFSLAGAPPLDAARPAKDLEQLRTFGAGQGPIVLSDLPWAPLFLFACFLLHPWIGALASLGVVLLVAMGFFAHRAAQRAEAALSREAVERANWTDAIRRNADTAAALGMERTFQTMFASLGGRDQAAAHVALDTHGTWAAYSRALRLALQSAVLGLGAVLVIANEMNVGAMIAASILTGRALHPAELAIAQWSSFVGARAAFARLKAAIALLPRAPGDTARPAPRQSLGVEDLAVVAPSGNTVLAGVGFDLAAGDVLGVIGPSGSGKTSLAKALTGLWPAARGAVRLDGVDIRNMNRDGLAGALGFLAQDAALFDATIAANIARLNASAPADTVLRAADVAGAKEMIERMPGAFERIVGQQGGSLSAGERQRVGLARALYGDPFLVVLDEPNANLDPEGEAALARALKALSARGAITVVIAHRASVLNHCNKLLALDGGRQRAFGTREATLALLREERNKSAVVPLRRPGTGVAT